MTRFPTLLAALSTLSLTACYESVSEHAVPEGSFVLSSISDPTEGMPDAAELGAVTMVIDREAATLTLTLEDGSEQVADLLLREKTEWEADCFTMNSHALTEVYDVDAESLSLGAVEIALPVLTAKCGGRPLLGSDGGDETFAGAVFVFDEAS